MKASTHRALVLAWLVFSAWGCMRAGQPLISSGAPQTGGYGIGDIVDTQTGKVVPLEFLIDELARVQVVYVGETHVSIEDHRVQEEILRRLRVRSTSLALGMEMFPRESQPALDQFSTGSIEEEAFLQRVNWERVWGFPFRLYRPILRYAQDKRIPVLGLNAPREIVSKIALSGLASLTPGERDRVARDFHLDDPKHREYVRKEFMQHMRENIRDSDTFFEAQLAWEETMAETLAQRLLSSAGKELIVVLVGKGHMSDRVGLPQLTLKRFAHTFKTVAPMPLDYPFGMADPDLADYVWVTDKSESFHRGKLGIMIRPLASGQGLEVVSVLPGSPAEKAGVKKGDVLTMVDGLPVKSQEDLHKTMMRTGNRMELILRREKQTLSVTVTVSP